MHCCRDCLGSVSGSVNRQWTCGQLSVIGWGIVQWWNVIQPEFHKLSDYAFGRWKLGSRRESNDQNLQRHVAKFRWFEQSGRYQECRRDDQLQCIRRQNRNERWWYGHN